MSLPSLVRFERALACAPKLIQLLHADGMCRADAWLRKWASEDEVKGVHNLMMLTALRVHSATPLTDKAHGKLLLHLDCAATEYRSAFSVTEALLIYSPLYPSGLMDDYRDPVTGAPRSSIGRIALVCEARGCACSIFPLRLPTGVSLDDFAIKNGAYDDPQWARRLKESAKLSALARQDGVHPSMR